LTELVRSRHGSAAAREIFGVHALKATSAAAEPDSDVLIANSLTGSRCVPRTVSPCAFAPANGHSLPLPHSLMRASIGDPAVIERLSWREHVLFPAWTCISCEQAWPCDPAKADLLVGLGWLNVAIYCGVVMERAAADLSFLSPNALWQRFLEWTEPPDEFRDALTARSA
jgi:hypothetical protein